MHQTIVNWMDQTRRLDCGSKADCSLKYTEDVRLADAVSNVSYRYLNNKLGDRVFVSYGCSS